MSADRYGALDGLRTIACFGIAMMHVEANSSYAITGFVYERLIPSFTDFVFLFMMISAFSMCCGYYERMLGKNAGGMPQIRLTDFYGRRYGKVLPFFAILCLLDFILSPSVDSLYELFADLTLVFGLLPDAGNISVIGVGWFLGVIFVFYLIFPFFCVLIENKRRAWISFGVSLIYSVVCADYFGIGRTNILYCGSFLLAGGLIYLYKDAIGSAANKTKWFRRLMPWIMVSAVVFYFTVHRGVVGSLLVCTALLLYAVSAGGTCEEAQEKKHPSILENRFTAFISGISMELYLSQMVMFRAVEKTGLNTLFGTGWPQYIVTVILVLVMAAAFAFLMQHLIAMAKEKMAAYRRKNV